MAHQEVKKSPFQRNGRDKETTECGQNDRLRQFLGGVTISSGAENLATVSFGQLWLKMVVALAQNMKKHLDEFGVVGCRIESVAFAIAALRSISIA